MKSQIGNIYIYIYIYIQLQEPMFYIYIYISEYIGTIIPDKLNFVSYKGFFPFNLTNIFFSLRKQIKKHEFTKLVLLFNFKNLKFDK